MKNEKWKKLRNTEDILWVSQALFYTFSFVFTLQRLLLSSSFSLIPTSDSPIGRPFLSPPMTLMTPPPLDVFTSSSPSPISLSFNSIFLLSPFRDFDNSPNRPQFTLPSSSYLAPRVTFSRSELLYFALFCSRRTMRCLFRIPTSLTLLSPWKVTAASPSPSPSPSPPPPCSSSFLFSFLLGSIENERKWNLNGWGGIEFLRFWFEKQLPPGQWILVFVWRQTRGRQKKIGIELWGLCVCVLVCCFVFCRTTHIQHHLVKCQVVVLGSVQ